MCILTLALKNALPATDGVTELSRSWNRQRFRETVTFLQLSVNIGDHNGVREVRSKPMVLDST